jgi:hypothetical protein
MLPSSWLQSCCKTVYLTHTAYDYPLKGADGIKNIPVLLTLTGTHPQRACTSAAYSISRMTVTMKLWIKCFMSVTEMHNFFQQLAQKAS